MQAPSLPLVRLVLKEIRRDDRLPQGARVVVAVSGGADSLALLHALAALHHQYPLELTAAYVDHGLRPEETEAEESLVQDRAAALGLAFHALRVDVTGRAARDGLSLEHAAREERYAALRTLAARLGAPLIAVGHTADDQVENLLLRLLRGAGRRGLSGMRPREGDLVRPLLTATRAQVIDFLASLGLHHLEDSSNRDDRFWRNRLRHEVLPGLEKTFRHGCRQAMLRSAAILAEEDALLAELTLAALPGVLRTEEQGGARCVLDRRALLAVHPAVQRRIVEQVLWRLGASVRHEHILAVVELARSNRGGRELHLSGGLRVGRLRADIVCCYPRGRTPWRGNLLQTIAAPSRAKELTMQYDEGFQDISVQDLREYLQKTSEERYLLVDVRQPGEYAAGHIPGAHLLPLPELAARRGELPPDREVIFYCRSGRRSRCAALFLADSGRRRAAIFHLAGGMLAWNGEQLEGQPALMLFDPAGDRAQVLYQAMEMEKGAWRFYRAAGERFAASPIAATLRELEGAEEGHARLLYEYWRQTLDNPPSFEAVYQALAGELLEGGHSCAALVARLDAITPADRIQVLELALSIELAAYDLYRALAQRWSGSLLEQEMLGLAQAERRHLEFAAQALRKCEG